MMCPDFKIKSDEKINKILENNKEQIILEKKLNKEKTSKEEIKKLDFINGETKLNFCISIKEDEIINKIISNLFIKIQEKIKSKQEE